MTKETIDDIVAHVVVDSLEVVHIGRADFAELLRSARLALKVEEVLRTHGGDIARSLEGVETVDANMALLSLMGEFGLPSLMCPHCDELLVESEGVEGPRGNLWHQSCLDGWRQE